MGFTQEINLQEGLHVLCLKQNNSQVTQITNTRLYQILKQDNISEIDTEAPSEEIPLVLVRLSAIYCLSAVVVVLKVIETLSELLPSAPPPAPHHIRALWVLAHPDLKPCFVGESEVADAVA